MNYAQRRQFWVECIRDATLLPTVLAQAFVDYGQMYQELWDLAQTPPARFLRQDYDWFVDIPHAIDRQSIIAARRRGSQKRPAQDDETSATQNWAVTSTQQTEQWAMAEKTNIHPIRRIWYHTARRDVVIDLPHVYSPTVTALTEEARTDMRNCAHLPQRQYTELDTRPLSTLEFLQTCMAKTVLPRAYYDTSCDFVRFPWDTSGTTKVYKKDDPKTISTLADFFDYATNYRGDYGPFHGLFKLD